MENFSRFLILIFLVGCAHGKMGAVTKELDRSAISKNRKIIVPPINVDSLRFSGDKAAKSDKIAEEKEEIKNRFNKMIVSELLKRGYNAVASDDKTTSSDGLLVKGTVQRFEHGSAAARLFVGMGAGSSNMYTDFKIVDLATKETLGEFEIIATSGGRGGLASMGSFLEAHLTDGAEKFAEYVSGEDK